MRFIVPIFDLIKQLNLLEKNGFKNNGVQNDEHYILVNPEKRSFVGQIGKSQCSNLYSQEEFERSFMNGTKFESKEQNLAIVAIIKEMGLKVHIECINHINARYGYGLSFSEDNSYLGTSFSGTLPVSDLLKQAEEIVKKNSTQYDVGEYKTVITKDELKVGCQTISFEKVQKIYNRMVELRK